MAAKPPYIPPRRAEKALTWLRALPRITDQNVEKLPHDQRAYTVRQGKKKGPKRFKVDKSNKGRSNFPPLGYEGGRKRGYTPIQERLPSNMSFNFGWEAKRQYPPLSLKTLQLMIDTGTLDPSKPIDLAALCNTKHYWIYPLKHHFGVHLIEDGADYFDAKINIEVQWANEQVIAAIESKGGVITTAYYDHLSVEALSDPTKFFNGGGAIPRRKTPPQDCIEFYTDAKNRGYLADPREIANERYVLAQKYGYELPDIETDPAAETLKAIKDPREVFFGLKAGWIVSLKEKAIYKPLDKKLKEFYQGNAGHE